MDIKQLECFIAVAEERHFTKAAQRLNLVQSGLSQTIRSLEIELGGPLFVRTTRHVDLTPAGTVLLKEAHRVISAARQARLAVTQVHGLAKGQLRIGSIQSLAPFVDLPASLSRFRSKYPGIDVQLLLDGALSLLDEVDEGRLDLVFTQPENVRVGMTSRMLACEELVLVCASTNAFASGASPTLGSLEGKTFIDLKADWGMRRLIDRSFSAKGLSRNSAFEVNDISMLLELVARDLGIALVPKSVAQSRLHDTASNAIAVIELVDDEAPCWELIVAYKGRDGKPGNKVTKTFLSLLVSNTGDSVQYEAEG
jgi:DNA-binding transcriptional LysR family regulator